MARILIVEDSPTDRKAIKSMLDNIGHSVSLASSGEEGVEKAKAEHPDLILMDIVMPGMNGFKATRTLSKDPDTASIPIIILSSKTETSDMEWAKRQGATGYLVKPASESDLVKAIDGALG